LLPLQFIEGSIQFFDLCGQRVGIDPLHLLQDLLEGRAPAPLDDVRLEGLDPLFQLLEFV